MLPRNLNAGWSAHGGPADPLEYAEWHRIAVRRAGGAMVHTNAIAYGFLANAFLGMLHWAVPRLTLQAVASRALSYFIFAAWQLVVLSTAAALIVGPTLQAQDWVSGLCKAVPDFDESGCARSGMGRDSVLGRPR